MELTDFCFVGHVTIGPRIIGKLEQKGVLNKTNIRGEQNSRVYYVWHNPKNGKYEIASEGVQSAFGKHILEIRENITVDIYQNFLQRLSEVFIPEEPKKRTKKEFTEEQTQKIIDLYKIGTPIKEIAEQFPNRDYKAVYNRIQYLKRKGKLPSNVQEKEPQEQKEECTQQSIEKDNKDVAEAVVDTSDVVDIVKKTQEVMMLELNLRIKSAVSLAAAMLVMGVEYTDDQLAERAVSIADKILEKINA